MKILTPAAATPNGAEMLSLRVGIKGGTVTLSQLKAWALGGSVGAGASNPPVGCPAVASLDGTEQVQVLQGDGWKVATVGQLASWATTGTAAAFALPASGQGLGGFPTIAALDGTETIAVSQAGGVKGLGLAALQTFITS